MDTPVRITFDCLPLRSVKLVEPSADLSPKFRQFLTSLSDAIDKHGRYNTYYLHQAECLYQLTNDPAVGTLVFAFEGTLLTDSTDSRTLSADLKIRLLRETCDWLTEPVVEWFRTAVRRAVIVEFDRYITAGDLKRTQERIESLQKVSEQSGGYLGMGL